MSREVTAKDLNLDDEEVVVDQKIAKTDTNPDEGSLDAMFKGDPADGVGKFGKEAFEEEVAEAKARQKKAEADRAAEELEKLEGKKDKKEEEKEALDTKEEAAAEKRVKDAQRKMHEATTKASKLEKIVSDLQKRVNEASKETPKTAPAENPWNVKRQKVADDTIAKAAAIVAPVPPQDRDDPEFDIKWADYQKKMGEYNGKVALVWAEAQTEIANLAFEEREEDKKNQEAVRSAVSSALEEAGLITDKTSQKEQDSILKLFWSLSADVPKSLPMEDQIKETTELCKDFIDELRGKERERAKKEKENQEDLQVLGRGSRVTTKKEPEVPRTMAEAKASVLERRKLRRNP